MSAQIVDVNGDLSSTQYAQRTRRLMELALRLQAIGAQAVVDIPRIVVIGGQSAGKSSLVEAVSGVRVPRDSGTCTRCPMECSMFSTTEAWSCQISLRFAYDDHGEHLRQIRQVDFGSELSDKAEVELVLRRAQAAILNPTLPVESFLAKTAEELQYYRTDQAFESGTLKFSMNAICVRIMDPQSADLSFVDLPGLIQNETVETVKLVEDLVRSNINKDCLILVTIPMSDDMENQKAKRLALETDPEKVRTIGVLTKPDMLTPGATNAREMWKDVIEGRRHPLQHGYYCVRLADDDERAANLSRLETQHQESSFFTRTPPWNLFTNRSRFGVPALVTDLSKCLTDIIDRALPDMSSSVQSNIEECRMQLAVLPPRMAGNPSSEIIDMISKFSKEINSMVYGNGGVKSFIQQNRASYRRFKLKIRATAPNFKPFEDSSQYQSREGYSGSDSEDSDSDTASAAEPMNLYDVRRVIQESIAWELPHNVPFDAKSRLIHGFTDSWEVPANKCYESIYKNLKNMVEEIIQKIFHNFPKLRDFISSLVTAQLQSQKGQGQSAVNAMLSLEKNPLFTQNLHYLDSVRKKWLFRYKEVRKNVSTFDKTPPPQSLKAHYNAVEVPYGSAQDRALRALSELGYRNISIADLTRLLPPDSFDEELVVMADVRAYFQVAYKRIIDYVPLTIEHSLNQALAATLETLLTTNLDFGSPDASARLADLLAEDPVNATRRENLEMRLKRLELVQQELRSFGLV